MGRFHNGNINIAVVAPVVVFFIFGKGVAFTQIYQLFAAKGTVYNFKKSCHNYSSLLSNSQFAFGKTRLIGAIKHFPIRLQPGVIAVINDSFFLVVLILARSGPARVSKTTEETVLIISHTYTISTFHF
jgi:hypothetical protein